eukprot:TRINITY_DN2487_c0_g1_i11.p3 TRINITY_DN2487_c0_g1~~TRINITY_DN2487_c0_g1_i11.p3  ORF type:complete len:331 (-),score=44.00 TRINITY_DN2487_c0_g1_i11:840-1832(-)
MNAHANEDPVRWGADRVGVKAALELWPPWEAASRLGRVRNQARRLHVAARLSRGRLVHLRSRGDLATHVAAWRRAVGGGGAGGGGPPQRQCADAGCRPRRGGRPVPRRALVQPRRPLRPRRAGVGLGPLPRHRGGRVVGGAHQGRLDAVGVGPPPPRQRGGLDYRPGARVGVDDGRRPRPPRRRAPARDALPHGPRRALPVAAQRGRRDGAGGGCLRRRCRRHILRRGRLRGAGGHPVGSPTEGPALFAAVVAGIVHAVAVAGPTGVMLGSDWDGAVRVSIGPGELVRLTAALLDAGLDEGAVEGVLGRNYVDFLGRSLPNGWRRKRVQT